MAAALKPKGAQPLYNTQLGDPLPFLDAVELGRFRTGEAEFNRVHTPEDGLGPDFNGTSCVQCHGFPVTGGALGDLKDLTMRIGRLKKNGTYSGLENLGGEPLSFYAVPGCEKQIIPKQAEFVSHRAGQQLFGDGLIDAIPESEILSHADPDDSDHDGISGRPNIVPSVHFGDTRIGRFGWKSHMPTLADFCSDAYRVEIGITSPDYPHNRFPNGVKSVCDPDLGPEDSDGRVTNAFLDYLSLLAPPAQQTMDSSALRGQQLFTDIGCAKCHIPTMHTGTTSDFPNLISPVQANQDINLYSDLLLHDMGDKLADGIETGVAMGSEWRTQPLWGLSTKKFLLHDGRTTDLTTAITEHGGEAQSIVNNFLKLSKSQQKDLINFLKTL